MVLKTDISGKAMGELPESLLKKNGAAPEERKPARCRSESSKERGWNTARV